MRFHELPRYHTPFCGVIQGLAAAVLFGTKKVDWAARYGRPKKGQVPESSCDRFCGTFAPLIGTVATYCKASRNVEITKQNPAKKNATLYRHKVHTEAAFV